MINLTNKHTPQSATPPRPEIIVYFSLITLTFGLGTPWSGGIASIPIQFFLKDQLHLGADSVAWFGIITGLPLFVGFLFGLLRDEWRGSGRGDQSILFLNAIMAVGCYIWLSFGSISYGRLLLAILVLTVLFQFLNASIQGMAARVAKKNAMTGSLSTISTLGLTLPSVIAALIGGWLAAHVTPQKTFMIVAAITGLILAQALWKPRLIFDATEEKAVSYSKTVRTLIRHREFWPAAMIQFLWNFAPAYGIPSFYYLTDQIKLSGAEFGTFTALQNMFFLPTVLVYGFVCRHYPLRRLLWIGVVLGVLQGPPLLFAHSSSQAMLSAIVFGLFGGFSSAVFWDLLLRSCPRGFEGTAAMLGWSSYWIANKGSDLLGAYLYIHGGFVTTIVITTISYVLIAPMVYLVPRYLTNAREGEQV